MDAFWKFVQQHLGDDPAALRLKYHVNAPQGIDVSFAITQIECRKKFGKKLAQTLDADPEFLFPSVLAGEQSTSDRLADYHATLVGSEENIVDLTAGLGIDAIHIALTHPNANVSAIDIDQAKTDALAYNIARLGVPNLRTINADCTDVSVYADPNKDTLYFIDPARRALDGSRIYSLADCQPDVVSLMHQIPGKWSFVIKASPMLDITHTANLVQGTSHIIALGTPTECKELVILADNREQHSQYTISAVTLFADGSASKFDFAPEAERAASSHFYSDTLEQLQGSFLYEPFPALMKAAPFNLLCQHYDVQQLHPNSHVYVSTKPIQNFPGTQWHIDKVMPYESKYIKRLKKDYPVINVATRNFDVPTDVLRRKLAVKDGSNLRLLATTLIPNIKVLIILSPYITNTQ